jgi:hypothetical protein
VVDPARGHRDQDGRQGDETECASEHAEQDSGRAPDPQVVASSRSGLTKTSSPLLSSSKNTEAGQSV